MRLFGKASGAPADEAHQVNLDLDSVHWLQDYLRVYTCWPDCHFPGAALLEIEVVARTRADHRLSNGTITYSGRL